MINQTIFFCLLSLILGEAPLLRKAPGKALELLDKVKNMLSRKERLPVTQSASAEMPTVATPTQLVLGDIEGEPTTVLGINVYLFAGVVFGIVFLFFIIYKYLTWVPKRRTVTKSSPASPERERLVSPTK